MSEPKIQLPPIRLGLTPVRLAELPPHPALESRVSVRKDELPPDRPRVGDFASSVLRSGSRLASRFPDFRVLKKAKISDQPAALVASAAPVELLVDEEAGGSWIGRRSRHVLGQAAGQADWSEFEYGLLTEHSQSEKDYAETVIEANQIMKWDTLAEGEGYGDVTISGRRR